MHDRSDVLRGPTSLDSVGVVFNEERLVSDAGLLTASLAERLGIACGRKTLEAPLDGTARRRGLAERRSRARRQE